MKKKKKKFKNKEKKKKLLLIIKIIEKREKSINIQIYYGQIAFLIKKY